jgi:hypothetical protein
VEAWLEEWWGDADPDERAWFEVQFGKCFQEYANYINARRNETLV